MGNVQNLTPKEALREYYKIVYLKKLNFYFAAHW